MENESQHQTWIKTQIQVLWLFVIFETSNFGLKRFLQIGQPVSCSFLILLLRWVLVDVSLTTSGCQQCIEWIWIGYMDKSQ